MTTYAVWGFSPTVVPDPYDGVVQPGCGGACIYIPDTAKEKPCKGEVVAAGPGKLAENGTRTPLAVKKGDMVLFNKYAGTEVKLDGIEHLVMREEDILAIID